MTADVKKTTTKADRIKYFITLSFNIFNGQIVLVAIPIPYRRAMQGVCSTERLCDMRLLYLCTKPVYLSLGE